MASWRRVVKGILSIGLIFGSVGFYGNSRLRLTATYAVVAAPAVSIHSPGDGMLTHAMRAFTISPAGSLMASVTPTPVNDPELRVAKAQLDTVRADVASLRDLIALGNDMRSKAESRQSVLGRRRAEQLERLVEKANAELAVKSAALEGAELARNRSVELCSQGLMVTQDCEALATKLEVERRELSAAEGQVGIARFALQSTRAGVDVGQDMGSEVTYARQQRDDLTLRMAMLKQQLETREAEAKALELRVSPPPIVVSAAARSRSWSLLRQSGSLVVKGEPLFEVVDCDQLFVFATISEDRYEKLRIGMEAAVRIGNKTYAGKVAQFMGPYGTFAQERSMQPQPPVIVNGADASSAAVAVSVPGLSSALGQACEVGTLAEVEFRR